MSTKSNSKGAAPAAWKDREDMTVLNTDLRRLDGPIKVTGRAVYPHDRRIEGMVYARLVLVPVPRAILTRVDVAPAQGMAGVVYAEATKKEGDDTKMLGDDSCVAVVAAETPELARDAARAVIVEYEEQLPPMVTREQSREADAPEISRKGNVEGEQSDGDPEAAAAGFDGAPFQVTATYEVPTQHHVCLETHGVVIDARDDGATVYPSTQMVSMSQGIYAGMLKRPADEVRIVCEVMGGGFGSKFGPGLEGLTASRLAREIGRPVHLMLDRPQEFQMAGNRSAAYAELSGAADAEGNLVALQGEVDRMGGMGGGSFPNLPYIYRVGVHHFTSRSVHFATDPNRAMRAPGHPQAAFCMESLVDELAAKGGFDPLEFRKRNLASPVYHRQLDRVAKEIGWNEHPFRMGPAKVDDGVMEGIGFGIAQWYSGGRAGAEAEIKIHPDGSIVSSCGVQDLGTGARTYVAAIPAEEFGLRLDQVTARIGDSDLPPGVPSGGSATTGAVTPAIKTAAHQAREGLEAKLVDAIGGEVGGFVWKDGIVYRADEADRIMDWKGVCALLGTEPLVARGAFDPALVTDDKGIHGAQAARVSVDTLTGEIRVLKMVQMQDVGIPLNRAALRSQMNGGMIQALSYALFEERVIDPDLGLMLTNNLEDYKIAGAQEMPEMVAIIDDEDTRPGTTGMAEASVIGGHCAIANAVYNACGARIRSLPITPDKVLAALGRV